MNMKRITDVPVIDELGENSYVLVNNNGEAAQISGSKVGGGELPALYVNTEDEGPGVGVFLDAAFERLADFETAKSILMQKPTLVSTYYGEPYVYTVLGFSVDEEYKRLFATIFRSANGSGEVTAFDSLLRCSDTEFPED